MKKLNAESRLMLSDAIKTLAEYSKGEFGTTEPAFARMRLHAAMALITRLAGRPPEADDGDNPFLVEDDIEKMSDDQLSRALKRAGRDHILEPQESPCPAK